MFHVWHIGNVAIRPRVKVCDVTNGVDRVLDCSGKARGLQGSPWFYLFSRHLESGKYGWVYFNSERKLNSTWSALVSVSKTLLWVYLRCSGTSRAVIWTSADLWMYKLTFLLYRSQPLTETVGSLGNHQCIACELKIQYFKQDQVLMLWNAQRKLDVGFNFWTTVKSWASGKNHGDRDS